MTEKYKNSYRSKSLRLQNWDYSSSGAYFVTLCTKNREKLFGEIVDNRIHLSHIGMIADILWYEIKNHSRNFQLGEFMVMPNHIHGILIIDHADADMVETRHALSLRDQQQSRLATNRFQNQGKNTISSIIGGYKSAVTKHARRLGFDFGWQRNYWEHIIRNEQSYQHISEYIQNNPAKWAIDKLNPESGCTL